MKIKLVRSYIGATPKQRATLSALGLKKIRQVKECQDSPVLRGMIAKVSHMVEVSE